MLGLGVRVLCLGLGLRLRLSGVWLLLPLSFSSRYRC